MPTNKSLIISAGFALWLPLVFSFVGGMSLAKLPGAALSQVPMVVLLVAATLLLGMLIGKAACVPAKS